MFYDTVFAFLKNLPLELNRYLKPSRRRYHYRFSDLPSRTHGRTDGHVLKIIDIDILVSIT